MTPPATPRRGPGPGLAIGLAALAGGLWLLLDAQGVGVPPFGRLWPALLVLTGVASLIDFLFLGRRPSSLGWAVVWVGFGVLGFSLTLGYTGWRKVLDWLPSFPMILGLGLLATWLVDRRRDSHLVIAAGVLIGLGLTGFAARFEWLQRVLPSAQVLWAGLLLAGGVYLIWRTVSRTRQPGTG